MKEYIRIKYFYFSPKLVAIVVSSVPFFTWTPALSVYFAYFRQWTVFVFRCNFPRVSAMVTQGPPAYGNENETKSLLVIHRRFHHHYKLSEKFPALFRQKCGHFTIFDCYSTISRGTRHDVLRKPGWETLPQTVDSPSNQGYCTNSALWQCTVTNIP